MGILAVAVCPERPLADNDAVLSEGDRPETSVALRTRHMNNTFRFFAGDVDAVEKVFGDGRTRPFCCPSVGWQGRVRRLQPIEVVSTSSRELKRQCHEPVLRTEHRCGGSLPNGNQKYENQSK